jgi:hypothetical protein
MASSNYRLDEEGERGMDQANGRGGDRGVGGVGRALPRRRAAPKLRRSGFIGVARGVR